ncbi:MAG: chemotaxis protein CheX [Vicinamibacterales bacterium]
MRDALQAAIAHVAEDSFFAMAGVAEPGWRDAWADQADWLESSVTFHGAGEGTLTCRLPRTLVRDLSAAFLGLTEDQVDDSIEFDMTGELANMVCGCWLTRAFPADLFALEPPEAQLGSFAPGDDWLIVMLNGAPLGVFVTGRGV